MLSWRERHAVGYIVGIARNKRLNAMTAQRQREAQDCYAALGTKVRWFTEIHYTAGNGDRKRRVITRGLKVKNAYLIDKYGGQGQNRTADTGIFSPD